jgi:hypothetical protein
VWQATQIRLASHAKFVATYRLWSSIVAIIATPPGILSLIFLSLNDQDSGFVKKLKKRLPLLSPLLVRRIGGLVNFMSFHGLVDQNSSIMHITGEYPSNYFVENGNSYNLTDTVANGLGRINFQRNLNAVMTATIGIQTSMLSLPIDQLIGGASKTLQASSSVLKTTKDVVDKGKTVVDMYTKTKTWVNSQRGDSVDIFIAAM